MKITFIILVFSLFLTGCDYNSKQSVQFRSENIKLLSYSPEIETAIIGYYSYDKDSSTLIYFDPFEMKEKKSLAIPGRIISAHFIENGLSIFVATSDIDGNFETDDGLLMKVDYATGKVLSKCNIVNRHTYSVAFNPGTKYVYMLSGKYDHYNSILSKCSLDSLREAISVEYGEKSENLELVPELGKIYVLGNVEYGNTRYYERSSGKTPYYNINVFDADLLIPITSIAVPFEPERIEYIGNNKLIVTNRYCMYTKGPTLAVIDASSDSIIFDKTLYLKYKMGLSSLYFEETTNRIYCTTELLSLWIDEYNYEDFLKGKPEFISAFTRFFISLNPDDFTFQHYFPSFQPLYDVVAVPGKVCTRVFCFNSRSEEGFLFYTDIPNNAF